MSGVNIFINTDKNIEIKGNKTSSGDGGVFYFNGDVAFLKNGTQGLIVQSNSATRGGVFYFSDGSDVALDVPMTIENNLATYGGVLTGSGSFSISGSGKIECSGNNATNGDGGDFAYISGGTVNLGGNFSSSGGNGTNGGAMYITGANINLNGTLKLTNNKVSSQGGAIYISGGNITFETGCDVELSNNNSSYNGGGLAGENINNINFNGGSVKINNNYAYVGGGICIYYGNNFNVNGGILNISYNSVGETGGGMYITFFNEINFNSGEFNAISNRGEDAGGFYGRGITIIFNKIKMTIADNRVRDDGGGIFISNGSNIKVSNTFKCINSLNNYSGRRNDVTWNDCTGTYFYRSSVSYF